MGTTAYYQVQTAWVDRPTSGSRTGRLRCAICGRVIGFRVHSMAGARKRKRRLLGTASGAAVALAVLVVYLTATGFFGGDTSTSYMVFLVMMSLLVLTALMGALLGFAEDGVRPHSWKGAGEGLEHRFRPLSLIQACRRPADGDRPQQPDIVFD